LWKDCHQVFGAWVEEDSSEDFPSECYTSLMDSQEQGDFSGARATGSPESLDSIFIGKLKHLCPSPYFTLSAWERDHLDIFFHSYLLHMSVTIKGKEFETILENSDSVDAQNNRLPVTVTTQEMSTNELLEPLIVEDSNIVPGYEELVPSDHSLDRMITALVPTFRESYILTPISIYLGKEVVVRAGSNGVSRAPSFDGDSIGKDLA
jgi:hypothetical protein